VLAVRVEIIAGNSLGHSDDRGQSAESRGSVSDQRDHLRQGEVVSIIRMGGRIIG